MTQFLIEAKDHTDSDAANRRSAVRQQHLARMKEEKNKGVFVIGGALLNENDEMIGSVIIVNMPDEGSVCQWIAGDPYITGKV